MMTLPHARSAWLNALKCQHSLEGDSWASEAGTTRTSPSLFWLFHSRSTRQQTPMRSTDGLLQSATAQRLVVIRSQQPTFIRRAQALHCST